MCAGGSSYGVRIGYQSWMFDFSGGMVKSIVRPDSTVAVIYNGVLCCPNPEGGLAVNMLEMVTSGQSGELCSTVLIRWGVAYQETYGDFRFPIEFLLDCGINLLIAIWYSLFCRHDAITPDQ
jgi:hypothetical protein